MEWQQGGASILACEVISLSLSLYGCDLCGQATTENERKPHLPKIYNTSHTHRDRQSTLRKRDGGSWECCVPFLLQYIQTKYWFIMGFVSHLKILLHKISVGFRGSRSSQIRAATILLLLQHHHFLSPLLVTCNMRKNGRGSCLFISPLLSSTLCIGLLYIADVSLTTGRDLHNRPPPF